MKENLRTLVVDDEQGVRFFLEETLRRSGHVVVSAASGEEALGCLRDTPFDLVLLDLKLGGPVDGLRVLQAIRWRWPHTIVIILTAHGSLESAVAAISEGVDDYLLKPVDADELRRAIDQVIQRRKVLAEATISGAEPALLQQGPFRVDLDKHTVTRNGQPLQLTPREFQLLLYLMKNSHRVVSPRELVHTLLDYQVDHLHEARQIIRWYIHALRLKVERNPTTPRVIVNVRGVGYRFVP